MASFIRTVSAVFLAIALWPAGVWAGCDHPAAQIDALLQDGLAALTVARALRDEAQAKRTDPVSACRFIQGSHDAYTHANEYFQNCTAHFEKAMADCPKADWKDLTASPEACMERLRESEQEQAALAALTKKFCKD